MLLRQEWHYTNSVVLYTTKPNITVHLFRDELPTNISVFCNTSEDMEDPDSSSASSTEPPKKRPPTKNDAPLATKRARATAAQPRSNSALFDTTTSAAATTTVTTKTTTNPLDAAQARKDAVPRTVVLADLAYINESTALSLPLITIEPPVLATLTIPPPALVLLYDDKTSSQNSATSA